MSASKTFTQDPKNIERVLALYLSPERPTLAAIAMQVGTTFHNVQHIVVKNLSAQKLKAEQALRYSRSKMGASNPMSGKNGYQHHNFIGDVDSGDGYLQRKIGDKYVKVHRIVMAEALGLAELPSAFDVHHIDGNKKNNALDNLALVTPDGHRQLHAKRSRFARSPLWAQWAYGTSKSPTIIPTQPRDS